MIRLLKRIWNLMRYRSRNKEIVRRLKAMQKTDCEILTEHWREDIRRLKELPSGASEAEVKRVLRLQ